MWPIIVSVRETQGSLTHDTLPCVVLYWRHQKLRLQSSSFANDTHWFEIKGARADVSFHQRLSGVDCGVHAAWSLRSSRLSSCGRNNSPTTLPFLPIFSQYAHRRKVFINTRGGRNMCCTFRSRIIQTDQPPFSLLYKIFSKISWISNRISHALLYLENKLHLG